MKCHGVWFDRHELTAIWSVAVAAVVDGRAVASGRLATAGGDIAGAAAEALVYSPELGVVIVEGSVRAAGAAVEGLASAPEVAGIVAEAAGAVFEGLASIVGGILEGLF